MSLRSVSNTNYVPDTLYTLFRSGEIDHFEFDGENSIAVYAGGRRETFDATVTQATLDEEREKHFADPRVKILGYFNLVVNITNRRGVLTGWTE